MPGFDRTGPLGRGPMTGRGRGYYRSPDWSGRSRNGWSAGFGRGWRHRFWATGIPGRGWWAIPFGSRSFTPEEELDELKREAAILADKLNSVRRQIENMSNARSAGEKHD